MLPLNVSLNDNNIKYNENNDKKYFEHKHSNKFFILIILIIILILLNIFLIFYVVFGSSDVKKSIEKINEEKIELRNKINLIDYQIKDNYNDGNGNEHLKNEINKLKLENKQLNQSIQALIDKEENFIYNITSLKEEKIKLKKEINKVEDEVKLHLVLNNNEKEELKNKTNKVEAELKTQIIILNNTIEELTNKTNKNVAELKAQIIILNNKIEELTNKTNKIKKDNDELTNRINDNGNDIIGLKNKMSNLNYENYKLENRIDDIENEKSQRNIYYKDLFKGSSIIKEEERKLISNWILPHYNLKFELLYNGKRDGFDISTFHSKCNNKGPTLIVAKLENGRRFGGFASESWEKNSGGKIDNNAFLFSLDNKIKYGIKKKGTTTIYGQPNSSILFGPSWDGEKNIGEDDVKFEGKKAMFRQTGLKYNFERKDLCGDCKFAILSTDLEVYAVKNYIK